jgi:hypothetical protein
MTNDIARMHRRYVPWLSVLFCLFVFRVAAQLTQKFFNLSFLPPFADWYSGAVSYGLLLSSQILIILVFCWVLLGFARMAILPRRRLGRWLLAFGAVYFSVMAVRLIAGLSFAADHPWLGASIPAFFHIVLASSVLLVGHFHFTYGKRAS